MRAPRMMGVVLDLLFIALSIAFVLVSAAYVAACDRLMT